MIPVDQKKKMMSDAGIVSHISDRDLEKIADQDFLETVNSYAKPITSTAAELKPMGASPQGIPLESDFPVREETNPNLTGRFTVKNFSSEEDPKALEYLKKNNPGLEFAQREGRIFSKSPNDKVWAPLDPKGFDVGDIGDVVTDIASPVIQGGIMALAPGTAPAELATNAAGGGVLGYGLQKAREKFGEYLGARTPNRPDPGLLGTDASTTEAVMGALPPAFRLATKGLAEASLSRAGTVPAGFYAAGLKGALAGFMGGGGLSNISRIEPSILKKYLRDETFGQDARKLMNPETGLDFMREIQNRTLKPAVENANEALQHTGGVIGMIRDNIDKSLAAQGFSDGVSVKSLHKMVGDLLGDIRKGPKNIKTQQTEDALNSFKQEFLMTEPDRYGRQMPTDFMNMEELSRLKNQLSEYANTADRVSDIKNSVPKALTQMAKRLQGALIDIEDRASVMGGYPKGILEKFRNHYANELDDVSALEDLLQNPRASYTNVSGSNLASAPIKRSLIKKYIPKTTDAQRDLDLILASRTAEKSTVNPAFGRLIPSMDLSRGYERAGKLSRRFKNPYSEAAMRAGLLGVGEFGQEQESQK